MDRIVHLKHMKGKSFNKLSQTDKIELVSLLNRMVFFNCGKSNKHRKALKDLYVHIESWGKKWGEIGGESCLDPILLLFGRSLIQRSSWGWEECFDDMLFQTYEIFWTDGYNLNDCFSQKDFNKFRRLIKKYGIEFDYLQSQAHSYRCNREMFERIGKKNITVDWASVGVGEIDVY